MKKRKKEMEQTWYSMTLCVVQGAALSIAFCLLFLFGCSGLVAGSVISEAWMDGTVLCVCVLSTFAAGVVQQFRLGRWRMTESFCSAGLVCAVFACIGILLWDELSFEQGRNVVAACLCGAGLSGILFGRPQKRRRT